MASQDYLKAVIPTPFQVLGFKLLPLSIGHIFTMEWAGLAYLTERAPELSDLINACLICSNTFRDYQQFLGSEELIAELKLAGESLDLAVVPEKLALFNQYLDEGTVWPEFEVAGGGGATVPIGAPWLQCLRTLLMSRLGVSSEEVWDYPYRMALWDCLCLRESEGKIQIIGEDDSAQHQDNVAAMLESNDEIRRLMGFAPGAEGSHGLKS